MRNDSTGGSPSAAVYTHGWDTVFALPVPDVNKAIVDKKSSPAGFSYTDPTSVYSVSGTFGDWQMVPGGDGKEVHMLLPLTAVTLTYAGTGKSQSYTGQVTLGIELHFLPHDEAAVAPSGGKPMALKVKATSEDPDNPVAFLVDLEVTPTPGTIDAACLKAGLTAWACDNLGLFAHVFAVVDLNLLVDQGKWGFVTPNYTSYAYLTDGDAAEDDLFGVLTMTGDRTGEKLNEQLPPNAIPAGSKSGFLVSQTRALYDLIRPAIMQAYPGLTDQNFLLSDDGNALYLTEGTSVQLAPVTQDGSTYVPNLTALSVQSVGETLTLTSHTETEIVAGITAICQSTHWYTVGLGPCNAGQTLLFSEAQPACIVHSINQSEGSHLTQLIIAIVGAVALLLLAVLTGGAALIVGGLVIGLLIGADMIVPAAIEDANKDTSPSIDLLLVNAVNPITWTASKVFSLTYGHMDNALQLGGDPNFI